MYNPLVLSAVRIHILQLLDARVVELVDAADSKSALERGDGSSPSSGTIL